MVILGPAPAAVLCPPLRGAVRDLGTAPIHLSIRTAEFSTTRIIRAKAGLTGADTTVAGSTPCSRSRRNNQRSEAPRKGAMGRRQSGVGPREAQRRAPRIDLCKPGMRAPNRDKALARQRCLCRKGLRATSQKALIGGEAAFNPLFLERTAGICLPVGNTRPR